MAGARLALSNVCDPVDEAEPLEAGRGWTANVRPAAASNGMYHIAPALQECGRGDLVETLEGERGRRYGRCPACPFQRLRPRRRSRAVGSGTGVDCQCASCRRFQRLYRMGRGGCWVTLYRDQYRVESARLQGWDYAWAGWYFVTLCTRGRACTLADPDIVGGRVNLTPIGVIAQQCFLRIPGTCRNVHVDAFVVMPNHLHGIVIIETEPAQPASPHRDDAAAALPAGVSAANRMSAISPQSGSLPAIMRSYKAAVTRRSSHQGPSSFAWQERYYDHIIRDDRELEQIRTYIANNPLQWQEDRLYPGNKHW